MADQRYVIAFQAGEKPGSWTSKHPTWSKKDRLGKSQAVRERSGYRRKRLSMQFPRKWCRNIQSKRS